jgi:hypothetical protein
MVYVYTLFDANYQLSAFKKNLFFMIHVYTNFDAKYKVLTLKISDLWL